ncbi:MAG TPA: cupin domain-containing protein [Solirubrobacterales bacterium]|nr:cupin domain-containing protein [Solirubrobacterales bacterium]
MPREDAHGGSGGRRLLATTGDLQNSDFEALTYGFLPGGSTFDWHSHVDIDEMMLVLDGSGSVSDRDGEYTYETGDFFIFPAGVEHTIHNPTDTEHEFVFVRLNVGR